MSEPSYKEIEEDSDDDDQIPAFLRKDFKISINEDDNDDSSNLSNIYKLCRNIEMLWLQRDVNKLQTLFNDFNATSDHVELSQAIKLILLILNGLHIQFFHQTVDSDEILRLMIIKLLHGCPTSEIRSELV